MALFEIGGSKIPKDCHHSSILPGLSCHLAVPLFDKPIMISVGEGLISLVASFNDCMIGHLAPMAYGPIIIPSY